MPYLPPNFPDTPTRTPKKGRLEYRVKGCKGLYLRVTPTGHQSWVTMIRVDGKQVRETLGPFDRIPTVKAAIDLARGVQDKARGGIDPRAERRAEAEQKAIDEQRDSARTVRRAIERYFTEHVERKLAPKTQKGY